MLPTAKYGLFRRDLVGAGPSQLMRIWCGFGMALPGAVRIWAWCGLFGCGKTKDFLGGKIGVHLVVLRNFSTQALFVAYIQLTVRIFRVRPGADFCEAWRGFSKIKRFGADFRCGLVRLVDLVPYFAVGPMLRSFLPPWSNVGNLLTLLSK